jgi:uncharacterized protein
MELAFVLVLGLIAGTISGIVGFGSSIMLMPILVIQFGPKEAVPIMAVAALMANFSRILVWWREVDWRAFAAYSVTGIPAAMLGATTLLSLPSRFIDAALGLFFILMIPVRRMLTARQWKLSLFHLAAAGAGIGYLTGIVVSTGPINVPIFLAYGLVKGGFIATEAAGSLSVYLSKAFVFRHFGALPLSAILKGLTIGASLMAGSFLSKRFVLKMEPDVFRVLMERLMLLSGLSLLWSAAQAAQSI